MILNQVTTITNSNVTEGRCGFILHPQNVGTSVDDIQEWHESLNITCCFRDVWRDGRCIWHADVPDKPVAALASNNADRWQWECLDGAILRNINTNELHSFTGCSLDGATFDSVKLQNQEFSDADLRWATFSDADLRWATFSDADLRYAEFCDADLFGAEFPNADLKWAKFPNADLSRAKFPDADLGRAKFPDADLGRAEFPRAYLGRVEFPDTYLGRAKFPNADLRWAKFLGANLHDAMFGDIKNMKPAILEDAVFEGSDLRYADFRGSKLYQTVFSDVRINSVTQFAKETVYEAEKEEGVELDIDIHRLQAAAWTHRRLESLHRDNAMSEKSRIFHVRKQEAERTFHWKQVRKSLRIGEYRTMFSYGSQYVVLTLMHSLTNHGESLRRILAWSVGIIFSSALLYPLDGFASSESNIVYQYDQGSWAMVRTFGDLGNVFSDFLRTFFQALYFSIITFTTIGYGDFYPKGMISKAIVGIESLAGAILIALFIFVLGRRVAR